MTTATKTETYTIPASQLETFEKAIATMNRKAKRLGLAPLTYELTEEYVADQSVTWISEYTEKTKDFKIGVIDVTVTGEVPALQGWQLAATLDFSRGKNAETGETKTDCIVYSFPGCPEMPDRFHGEYTTACDHCNTTRFRRKVYVVWNVERNEWLQVGSTCVVDFLGGKNYAKQLEFMADLFIHLSDEEKDRWEGGRNSYDLYMETNHVLATCIAVIRQHGYISGAKAEQTWTSSTANELKAYFYSNGKDYCWKTKPTVTEEDRNLAIKTLDWVRSLEGANDFEKNLKTILSKTEVALRFTGFITAAYPCYSRAVEREMVKKAEANSNHLGAIKDRVTCNVKVTGLRFIEGYRFSSTLISMIDDQGNVLKWFASNPPELEIGRHYTLTGTVKAHDEWRGTKNTVLTRCKIVEVKEVAA